MDDHTRDDGDQSTNEWQTLADWVGEATELARRGVELAAQVRNDWEQLARSDQPWTTDTIMNEVVNSWEHLTPLLGDTVQHSIELGSWWLRNFWPTAEADLAEWRSTFDGSATGEATSEYLDMGQRAVRRMLASDYDSADAVDDWAVAFGTAAKEAWKQAAAVRDGSQPRDGPKSQ